MENSSLKEFSILTASSSPTPGGGGVCGACGALAASLAQMVTNLTIGKKKYLEYTDQLNEVKERAEDLRIKLLDSINGDAKAFMPLARAYSMDKNDPNYETNMEECLRLAASSPALIFDYCLQIIDLDIILADIGSKLSVSDAATSLAICNGLLDGCLVNVLVNTNLMKDREYADKLVNELNEKKEIYQNRANIALDKIIKRISNG